MYTPKHLEWLDRQGGVDGWPVFITPEARQFCIDRINEGFAHYGVMSLDLARRCIFDGATGCNIPRPECLKLGLWDAIYGVTHRALLEVTNGEGQVWMKVKPGDFVRFKLPRKNAKQRWGTVQEIFGLGLSVPQAIVESDGQRFTLAVTELAR